MWNAVFRSMLAEQTDPGLCSTRQPLAEAKQHNSRERHQGPPEEGVGLTQRLALIPASLRPWSGSEQWDTTRDHRLHHPDCSPDRALHLGKLLAPLDP